MRDTRKDILSYIARTSSKKEPISTTELLKRFTSLSNQNLNHHLNALLEQGKIKKSEYYAANGARKWYVKSSRNGSTITFDVNGKELTWEALVKQINKDATGNAYLWELGRILNAFARIREYGPGEREVMEDSLSLARENLQSLSIRINTVAQVISDLQNDPAFRNADILKGLTLEKVNLQ